MDFYSYITTHKNKKVNVTIEFPKQTDWKAEQEFIFRLKELYLEKVKTGSCIDRESVLLFDKLSKVEEMGNGKES